MTSPLPPSEPQAPTARATPVMFGQQFTNAAGEQVTAPIDGVLLEFLTPDGAASASYFDSIRGMMRLSTGIATACGMATLNTIGDDGKRLPLADRLRSLGDR